MANPPNLPASAYELSFDGPSDLEQYMVELVNRARLNPAAEAQRQGTGLGDTSAAVREVLAVVAPLDSAAQLQSDQIISMDFFAHTNPFTGSTPSSRARDAGYGAGAGENIAIWGGSGSASRATETQISQHHTQFWNSIGHRENFLRANYSEIGIAQTIGAHNDYGSNTSAVTQMFGDRGLTYLTGVVIDDADRDRFYDVGEGQGGVRITAFNSQNVAATSTWAAGGYSLALEPGKYTVVFEGGELDGRVEKTVTIRSSNVKLDIFEDEAELEVSEPEPTPPTQPPSQQSEDETLYGTDGNDTIDGGPGKDKIYGGSGNDKMYGGLGNDKIYGGSGFDNMHGGTGVDVMHGGLNGDRLYGNGDADRMFGNNGDDQLYGGSGNDQLYGGGHDDRLYGGDGNDRIEGDNGQSGNDKMYGGTGFDNMHGGNGFDVMHGGINADRLYGNGNADRMFGNDGEDQLFGGWGDDLLNGGKGDDRLTGGAGLDTFLFAWAGSNSGTIGQDRVLDFQDDVDQIDFSRVGLSKNQILGRAQDTADGVVVTLSNAGDEILFEGVSKSDIQDDLIV